MFAKDNSISKQMIKMSVKKYLHSLLAVFALSALAVGLTAIVPVIYQKITDEFIPEKKFESTDYLCGYSRACACCRRLTQKQQAKCLKCCKMSVKSAARRLL